MSAKEETCVYKFFRQNALTTNSVSFVNRYAKNT